MRAADRATCEESLDLGDHWCGLPAGHPGEHVTELDVARRDRDTMLETLTICQERCTALHNEKSAAVAAERLRIRTILMALVTEADEANDAHVAIWTEEVLRRISPVQEPR